MEATEATSKKALVKAILQSAEAFHWTLSRSGLLRLRLQDMPEVRLHVWDSRFRNPGTTMVHSHVQWGLHSEVIVGRLINVRYREAVSGCPFEHRLVRLDGGFLDPGPQLVRLESAVPEEHLGGTAYEQATDEIHETDAVDGTVTLVTRTPSGADVLRVFWQADRSPSIGESRQARQREVSEITTYALTKWFA